MSDLTIAYIIGAILVGSIIGRLTDLFGATGLLQTRKALANERAECERLREIIFNSGAEKTPGSDASGDLSRIQEPAHRWDCKKKGHQFSRVIQKNRHLYTCRRCNYSIGESA